MTLHTLIAGVLLGISFCMPVGPVTIEARISQGGQANSAPGDLLGSTAALDPAKAGPLRLVIDREVR